MYFMACVHFLRNEGSGGFGSPSLTTATPPSAFHDPFHPLSHTFTLDPLLFHQQLKAVEASLLGHLVIPFILGLTLPLPRLEAMHAGQGG